MIKPKKLAGYAVFGFVLSFLISLISTHKFGAAFLRGLIFAALFAGISALIQLVEDKFLDVGDIDMGIGSSASNAGQRSSSGNTVDITISDENLTDDAQGPSFSVDSNRHGLDVRDTKASAASERPSPDRMFDAGENMGNIPVAKANTSAGAESGPSLADEIIGTGKGIVSADDDVSDDDGSVTGGTSGSGNMNGSSGAGSGESSGFRPIKLGTPLTGSGGQDASGDSGRMSKKAAMAAEKQAAIEEIGALPDISDYVPDSKTESEDIIDDSDFAETVDNTGPSATPSHSDVSDMQSKDVETMASAIRTLLKRDE